MKAVVQRVRRAAVRVEGREVARIGPGMLVLLGVLDGDDAARAERLAERVATLRFFEPESGGGRMERAAAEAGAEALVVSEVTLAHERRKGRRPSLDRAAPPPVAEELYLAFAAFLGARGIPTRTGVFGARMEVELTNDGPVTFVLDEGWGRPSPPSQVLA